MDQRVQFIADYQRDVFDVAALARRYGISRKTAYKWLDRYEVGGPGGLVDRSRRPAHCPHATPEPIIAALLEVRRHHPTWGAKKLLKVVAKRQPAWTLPARRTGLRSLGSRGPHHGAATAPDACASGPTADPDDGTQRDVDRGLQGAVQDPRWGVLLSLDDRRRLQPVPAGLPRIALDRHRHGPTNLPPPLPGVQAYRGSSGPTMVCPSRPRHSVDCRRCRSGGFGSASSPS